MTDLFSSHEPIIFVRSGYWFNFLSIKLDWMEHKNNKKKQRKIRKIHRISVITFWLALINGRRKKVRLHRTFLYLFMCNCLLFSLSVSERYEIFALIMSTIWQIIRQCGKEKKETWNCAECMCWSEVSSYMLKTMIDYIIIETLVYLWFLIYNCHPAIVITFRTPSSSLPLGRFISIVFTFCCCHGRLVFCKSKCTCYSYQLVIRLIWMVSSSDTFKSTRDIWRKKIVFFSIHLNRPHS